LNIRQSIVSLLRIYAEQLSFCFETIVGRGLYPIHLYKHHIDNATFIALKGGVCTRLSNQSSA
jgi:hypothetical protein